MFSNYSPMRITTFLLLVCFSVAGLARNVNDNVTAGTVISGVVMSAKDNSPLNRALVREVDLNDSVYNRAFTDKEGRFSFEMSDTGHVLMVYASGFYGEPEYDIVAMALDKSYYEITLEPYTGQEVKHSL